MFLKRKGRWALVVTHVLMLALGILLGLAYVKMVVLKKEKNKYLEFMKKDGQIFVGVVMPNDILVEDESQNRARAEAFLNQSEANLYVYMQTLDYPFGYNGRVYVFEALPVDQRLAIQK